MDIVDGYTNQEKLKLYDRKTFKKNIASRKTHYIWYCRGSQPDPMKKIVGVSPFSTFLHPGKESGRPFHHLHFKVVFLKNI